MRNDNRIPWWLWPNVLNLDAPVLTVAWQELFARSAGVHVVLPERAALFLAVWIIYAADRLLDGLRLGVRESSAARHRFAHRHWRLLAVALVVAAVSEAVLVLTVLPLRQFAGGVALGLLVAVYFVWNQLAGAAFGRNWLKEVVVSVVFALGAAFVPLLEAPSRTLWLEVGGFVWVCLANSLFIARVDRARDRDRGELSIAAKFHPSMRPSRWLAIPAAVVFLAVLPVVGPNAILAALLGSALLLAAAPVVEARLGGEAACVWVDAALLTPLLTIPFA